MNTNFLFKGHEELITQVTEFFFARVLKPDDFARIVSVCVSNPENIQPNQSHRNIFIEKGQFSLKDFLYYWRTTLQPQGGVFPSVIIEEVLRRFCSNHLLHHSELLSGFGLDYYHVNEEWAKFMIQRDALENLIFDFSRLVRKYSESIVHLVVKDQNNDQWSGTGFLFIDKLWILTNKHVIEADVNQLPRVVTSTGVELPVRKVQCSKTDDLALIVLNKPFEARPLFPMTQVDTLDEIVTMGFPRIPFAAAAAMVAHKGEINGHIRLTLGDRLLFSAKTAPGNSGGPLLARSGLVVGIVTENLTGNLTSTKDSDVGAAGVRNLTPYFTAIPSAQIAAFIQEILPPPLLSPSPSSVSSL